MAANFRDYSEGLYNYVSPSLPVGVQTGPIYYTGNVGGDQDDFQVADDLNGNGKTFSLVTADLDGNGAIDDGEIVGTFVDFGDLYEFNVFFDGVRIDAGLRANSYELMKQHVLHASPGVNTRATGWRFDAFLEDWQLGFGDQVNAIHPVSEEVWGGVGNKRLRRFVREMRTSTYATAGLRVNDYRSWFDWLGTGSILGQTGARVENDHFAIGPQTGFGAVAESSFWRFEAVALGFVGYQHVDYELTGIAGQELIPGGVNRLASDPTTTHENDGEDDFAWGFETRLTAGAQLTRRWRFDAMWRWAVVGPIHDAANSMEYTLPEFGLRPVDGDEMYLSDLFLGLTYTR